MHLKITHYSGIYLFTITTTVCTSLINLRFRPQISFVNAAEGGRVDSKGVGA